MAERNVLTVIREMNTIKSAIKDPTTCAALLAPLEAELKARVDALQRQGTLPGVEEKAAKK